MPSQQKSKNPPCPQCHSKGTVKKGKRRNLLRTLPIFQCVECLHRFTGAAGKYRMYPLRNILDAVSAHNLGHSLQETQRMPTRLPAIQAIGKMFGMSSEPRPQPAFGEAA